MLVCFDFQTKLGSLVVETSVSDVELISRNWNWAIQKHTTLVDDCLFFSEYSTVINEYWSEFSENFPPLPPSERIEMNSWWEWFVLDMGQNGPGKLLFNPCYIWSEVEIQLIWWQTIIHPTVISSTIRSVMWAAAINRIQLDGNNNRENNGKDVFSPPPPVRLFSQHKKTCTQGVW